jgi:hypothetical protein
MQELVGVKRLHNNAQRLLKQTQTSLRKEQKAHALLKTKVDVVKTSLEWAQYKEGRKVVVANSVRKSEGGTKTPSVCGSTRSQVCRKLACAALVSGCEGSLIIRRARFDVFLVRALDGSEECASCWARVQRWAQQQGVPRMWTH